MNNIELKPKATKAELAILLQDLRDSFASRSDRFIAIMGRKIIEKEFSIYQVKRAINKVIEDCGYNELSISVVLKACEKESPYRMVEYESLRPNGSWLKVITSESIYIGDANNSKDGEKPRFIRYID